MNKGPSDHGIGSTVQPDQSRPLQVQPASSESTFAKQLTFPHTDASLTAAGFVILTEDDPNQNTLLLKKTLRTNRFDIKNI